MIKKMKLSVCCLLTLLFMFTLTGASVFASDTKTVTVDTERTFTCTGPEISGYMQGIQNSTYSYNDGSYKGVLNCSSITSFRSVCVGKSYNNLDMLQVTVGVRYSGTVTKIVVPPTKSVLVTVDKTFACNGIQVSNNMQSIQNSTYFYDDGSYRGNLKFSKFSDVKTSVVGHNSEGDILQFNCKVEYSGTVTSY